MVRVKELMPRSLAWIESTQTVSAASHIMRLRRIGSLLVLQGSEIIGIITERDIIRKVVACHLQPECVHVKQIMSTPVVSIDETESIFETAGTMKASGTRHLAVGNEEQVRGMLLVRDLLSPVSREEL
jgi:signal-transduction protein with cAMP-binding, CBS, and nucleotidyltransferase domain